MSETKIDLRQTQLSNKRTEGIPGFDWEEYEAYSPKLRENKKIKKHPGDHSKVYCHAPYAQELYELYYCKTLDLKEPI